MACAGVNQIYRNGKDSLSIKDNAIEIKNGIEQCSAAYLAFVTLFACAKRRAKSPLTSFGGRQEAESGVMFLLGKN